MVHVGPPAAAPARDRRRAGLILLALAALGMWVTSVALRGDRLPRGSVMPRLTYQTRTGARVLDAPDSTVLVVMLFRTTCGACGDELRQLEASAHRLADVRLVLLTPEPMPLTDRFARTWVRLSAQPGVEWGTMDANALDEAFGRLPTPTTFVFGPDGRLQARLIGEVPADSLFRTFARARTRITPPTVGALDNRDR